MSRRAPNICAACFRQIAFQIMKRVETLTNLEEGNAGVMRTVARMVAIVHEAEGDPLTKELGDRLLDTVVGALSPAYTHGIDQVLYRVVTQMVRTEDDPADVQDQIKTPATMLSEIAQCGYSSGDCDDYAVLLAFLYRRLGRSVRYCVVSQDPSGLYDHVVAEINRFNPDRWIPLDPVTAEVLLGDRRLGFDFMVPAEEITAAEHVAV